MTDEKCCRDMLEKISEYIDGGMDPAACKELEKHLESCENCHTVLETMRKTIFLYKDTTESAPVPEDVRERLYQCLGLEDLAD